MNKIPSTIRILAVDPGVRYLGVAVLDGEELVWYGVKTFADGRLLPSVRSDVRLYLAELVQKFEPDMLVVEEPFYAQSQLSDNLKALTEEIKTWGKWKGLRVRSYLPTAVKAFFCRDKQTKQSLAEAMIAIYPFLRRYFSYLPWRQRYWHHVFDAVGLALMCQRKLAR